MLVADGQRQMYLFVSVAVCYCSFPSDGLAFFKPELERMYILNVHKVRRKTLNSVLVLCNQCDYRSALSFLVFRSSL